MSQIRDHLPAHETWRKQTQIVILLLILIAVAIWGSLCSRPAEPIGTSCPTPVPTTENLFPLVRVPGVMAEEDLDLVEFVVGEGQWLVLVLDPDAPAVQLPTAGTWMAAASIVPAEHLELCRKRDDCVTILSLERLD